MDNSRKMGDITNSTFGDNANFQGDAVIQMKINNSEFDKYYEELLKDINKITNESQQQQATFFAEQLRDVANKGDKSTAEKLVGFLRGALGDVSSLATIAAFFRL